MSTGVRTLVRKITLSGTPNTVQNLWDLILALSPTTKIGGAFTQLTLKNSGSGNFAVSDNSAIAAEGDYIVPPGESFNEQSNGSQNDFIYPQEYYLLSATASQTLIVIARSQLAGQP